MQPREPKAWKECKARPVITEPTAYDIGSITRLVNLHGRQAEKVSWDKILHYHYLKGVK